jgi:hypothetical protein
MKPADCQGWAHFNTEAQAIYVAEQESFLFETRFVVVPCVDHWHVEEERA